MEAEGSIGAEVPSPYPSTGRQKRNEQDLTGAFIKSSAV